MTKKKTSAKSKPNKIDLFRASVKKDKANYIASKKALNELMTAAAFEMLALGDMKIKINGVAYPNLKNNDPNCLATDEELVFALMQAKKGAKIQVLLNGKPAVMDDSYLSKKDW